MSVESWLYNYTEPGELLGVITQLQIAGLEDEDRVSVLQDWCARVGDTYEDWMGRVVVGPPVGVGGEESEAEVSGEII